MKEVDRPYKVWGYPYVPALAIAGMLILLVVTLMNNLTVSLLGLFVILIGNGVYDVWMDRFEHEPPAILQPVKALTESKTKTTTTKRTTKKAK
jgi:hypothetical protein